MRSNSVRSKLAFWNVTVLSIALLLLGLGISYGSRNSLLAAVDKDMKARVDRLVPRVQAYLRDFPPGQPEPVIRVKGVEKGSPVLLIPGYKDPVATFSLGNGEFEAVPTAPSQPSSNDPGRSPFRTRIFFADSGRTMSGDKPIDAVDFERAKHGISSVKEVMIDNEHARLLTVPVVYNGKIARVIQYPQALSGTYNALSGITTTLMTVLPLILVLATIGAWILTAQALQPVREMTTAAATISAENLDGRLAIHGNDEFSKLARTFNGMLERLQGAFVRMEQAVTQQRRFTADASHELRTPLTVIKANTSLALKGKRSVEEYRRTLAAVNAATDSMNRLVHDLLLLARSDDGQLEVPHEPLCLKPLLKEAVCSVERPGVAPIALQVEDKSLEVSGDGHGLIRVFVNLLENAARYTPETGSITLCAHRIEDQAVIEVQDTGVGISPEHLPHLMDRFYRVDEARARSEGGSGLGLSICKSIVESHGGTLEIASVPDQGTTATVRLPLLDPHSTPD